MNMTVSNSSLMNSVAIPLVPTTKKRSRKGQILSLFAKFKRAEASYEDASKHVEMCDSEALATIPECIRRGSAKAKALGFSKFPGPRNHEKFISSAEVDQAIHSIKVANATSRPVKVIEDTRDADGFGRLILQTEFLKPTKPLDAAARRKIAKLEQCREAAKELQANIRATEESPERRLACSKRSKAHERLNEIVDAMSRLKARSHDDLSAKIAVLRACESDLKNDGVTEWPASKLLDSILFDAGQSLQTDAGLVKNHDKGRVTIEEASSLDFAAALNGRDRSTATANLKAASDNLRTTGPIVLAMLTKTKPQLVEMVSKCEHEVPQLFDNITQCRESLQMISGIFEMAEYRLLVAASRHVSNNTGSRN